MHYQYTEQVAKSIWYLLGIVFWIAAISANQYSAACSRGYTLPKEDCTLTAQKYMNLFCNSEILFLNPTDILIATDSSEHKEALKRWSPRELQKSVTKSKNIFVLSAL